MSDSSELLKPNTGVTDGKLQIEIGNLRAENHQLRRDLDGYMKDSERFRKASHELEVVLKNNCQYAEAKRDEVRANYAALLESSTAVTNKLRQELAEVRAQLATERADREEIEGELSDLKQKSATAGKDLPEAADLLNQLKKAKGKKSSASLADVEAILEMIEKS